MALALRSIGHAVGWPHAIPVIDRHWDNWGALSVPLFADAPLLRGLNGRINPSHGVRVSLRHQHSHLVLLLLPWLISPLSPLRKIIR